MQEKKMLLKPIPSKPGGWEMICPWSSSHTTSDGGTHYFEAHTNGYMKAGFHCFHSHCKDKNIEHFKKWLNNNSSIILKNDWPIPIPLPESLSNVAEFNEDLLPNCLKNWILDIAERMQIPPDFSAAALFVVLGSLVGRKLGIYPKQMDNWIVIANLWGAVIGRPSLLKSPAIAEVMKPLERLILESMKEHKIQYSFFEKQRMVADAQKAAFKENLKRVAQKDNSKLEEVINSYHEPLMISEPILKRYKTDLGGIQPGPTSSYVYQATAGGKGDDGLLQRFQMTVWPDAPKNWKNIDRFPDNQAEIHAYEVFKLLDRLAIDHHKLEEGEIPALRFSQEAQEIFNAWRTDLELRLRKGELLPALESHLAKYRSLMPSIALIFYVVEALSKDQPLTVKRLFKLLHGVPI